MLQGEKQSYELQYYDFPGSNEDISLLLSRIIVATFFCHIQAVRYYTTSKTFQYTHGTAQHVLLFSSSLLAPVLGMYSMIVTSYFSKKVTEQVMDLLCYSS